jgi:hypothetical protein
MSRQDKFLRRLLAGYADADLSFADLCGLLYRLGFNERIRDDHHIFSKAGVEEILNLQPVGSKSKPYQVKQVRMIIQKYRLDEELD